MSSLRMARWFWLVVQLLQLLCVTVQKVDPTTQKLRRLNQQFLQFQVLMQARLDLLVLEQNRNSSRLLEGHVQALNDHYQHVSHDLEHLKHSTTQEVEALRRWSRKLEKKNSQMEVRLALMERILRENCHHTHKLDPDPSLDISNLTLELQSQEERLAELQVQRDELLVGLKGLQESLKNQALRVTRVEGRLSDILQSSRPGMVSSNLAPQKTFDPHRRGARPGRVLDSRSPTDHQYHAAYQPKRSKAQRSRLYSLSPERQGQTPSPTQQQSQASPHADTQNQTGLKAPPVLPESRTSRWDEGEDRSDPQSSVIQNLLQVPAGHKIPAERTPRREATLCNVDSMLLFPSASAENYVTFTQTLPDLAELSVCLWLHVEASRFGTLLSYATEHNDNQLVLYGSSSASLDFVIGDPVYRRLSVSFRDPRWHHLCVLWSSIQGQFWHYSDGRLSSSGSGFRRGWEIPGGGSVVLGQEQDSVGGGFDPAEGFAGQMSGFRLWNRVLSPSEVEGVAEGRGVPRGVVLGMEDIKEVHGEVQEVGCECLENCAA